VSSLFPDRPVPRSEVHDVLDRCYTPSSLAEAIVERVYVFPRRIVEPSVGGGAFVRAARAKWPEVEVVGVDLDPEATGLALCDRPIRGDYLDVLPDLEDVDLVIGNLPFGVSLDHVRETRARLPGAHLVAVLPWAYPGVRRWADYLAADPPASVTPILGRPWNNRVRETAVYHWTPVRISRVTILGLPAIKWRCR